MMRFLTILATLSFAVFFAPVVSAQPDPGDVGVYFDETGTNDRQSFPVGELDHHFWVIAFDTPGDLLGYEFGLIIDPTLMIVERTMLLPGINVGSQDNWIVGLNECTPGLGAVGLVRYQFGVLSEGNDFLICLGPSEPSSFNPPTPGYLDCGSGLAPFGTAQQGGGEYPDGCAVVNPTPDCPPLPSTHYFVLPDVEVPRSATARLTVDLDLGYPKCLPPLIAVDAVEFRVEFDPAVAEFVQAATTTTTEGWTITTSSPQAGVVDVALSGPEIYASPAYVQLLELEFLTTEEGGATTVTTSQEQVLHQGGAMLTGSGQGMITTLPIATEPVSFSSVKARY